LDKVRIERTSTQGFFLEVPANTRVPGDWTRRGGLQKVERYTTAELERHAVSLAEAEAVLVSETKALLAHVRGVAATCAGEARDLGRHLVAADALCSVACQQRLQWATRGAEAQISEDLRGLERFAFTVEVNPELTFDVLARTDQQNLGALVVEQIRRVRGDESTTAKQRRSRCTRPRFGGAWPLRSDLSEQRMHDNDS
jgi:hypothetical protein